MDDGGGGSGGADAASAVMTMMMMMIIMGLPELNNFILRVLCNHFHYSTMCCCKGIQNNFS